MADPADKAHAKNAERQPSVNEQFFKDELEYATVVRCPPAKISSPLSCLLLTAQSAYFRAFPGRDRTGSSSYDSTTFSFAAEVNEDETKVALLYWDGVGTNRQKIIDEHLVWKTFTLEQLCELVATLKTKECYESPDLEVNSTSELDLPLSLDTSSNPRLAVFISSLHSTGSENEQHADSVGTGIDNKG
jgi:hypothetical protein